MSRGLAALVALSGLTAAVAPPAAAAQVYGYTDDKGILILSNVATSDRMRLIVDDSAEPAGKTWHYSGQYDGLIRKAASLFGVDSSLVRAVIAVESAFNRYARSHKGARGLMQLMPDTGRRYGLSNAYDPWQNIRAGTAHLRDLLDEFQDLQLALAAYNAGATPVRRYRSIPPYTETRNYVRKVMAIYGAGSKIEIVRGNRVYTIGRPGGRTEVSEAPAGTAGGSSLAELARRVKRAQASRALPTPSAAPPPAPLEVAAAGTPGLVVEQAALASVYYRFVGPEGAVFITRVKPESYPYEILQP